MQLIWTDSFKSQVLFNASQAYIKQVGRGFEYKGLQPVYSLNIINENFDGKPDIFIFTTIRLSILRIVRT